MDFQFFLQLVQPIGHTGFDLLIFLQILNNILSQFQLSQSLLHFPLISKIPAKFLPKFLPYFIGKSDHPILDHLVQIAEDVFAIGFDGDVGLALYVEAVGVEN